MAKRHQQPDPLVGRRVRISDNATLPDGEAHPWRGEYGVIREAEAGGTYQVALEMGGTTSNTKAALTMQQFTVQHEGGELERPATGELMYASPWLVAPSRTNPRKRRGLDLDSLNALAASIKAQDLAQPILVRSLPGDRAADTFQDREEGRPLPTHELVCGERRLRASRIAGMETIPMLVRDLTDDQALELQLVENIEREDLDALEEAEGFELLRTKLGYTVEQIAERIGRGKGESYVRKTMKLVDLCPEAREAMEAGHLGRSTGLLVARYAPDRQPAVVQYILSLARGDEPAPFRTVAPEIHSRFNLNLSKVVWLLEDADLVSAAGACSSCSKRTGAQGDLYGDAAGQDDSCTDDACFAGKKTAHIERAKAEAAKQGFKVLTDEEAKAATLFYRDDVVTGDWVRLDGVAYTEQGDDGEEREVTYEDALSKLGKKAPKPRVLIHPATGKAIKVISDDLADKLMPAAEPGEDDEASAGGSRRAAPTFTEEEEAVRDSQVLRALMVRIFDTIRTSERQPHELTRIAKVLYDVANQTDGPLSHIEEYLGWTQELEDLEHEEVARIAGEKIDAMLPDQLGQFIAMVAVEVAAGNMRWRPAACVEIAKAYDLDILAVRDKVAEDLARQDQQEEGAEEREEEAA